MVCCHRPRGYSGAVERECCKANLVYKICPLLISEDCKIALTYRIHFFALDGERRTQLKMFCTLQQSWTSVPSVPSVACAVHMRRHRGFRKPDKITQAYEVDAEESEEQQLTRPHPGT